MSDYETKIKITEDGASKTADAIGGIGKAFKALVSPINTVRSGVANLFRAMGTISLIVHGVQLAIDVYQKLEAWINRAKTAAFELMKSSQDARFADALSKSAEKAKYLQENLAKTLGTMKEMQQFQDAWNAGQRGIEAARLNLQEQRDLAGVTDPEKRSRISESYALTRAEANWRGAATDAAAKSSAIDSQIAQIRASNDMEGRHQQTTQRRLDDVRFWLNDGRLSDEEREKRYKLAEALEKEIAASRKRSAANEELITSLQHQKQLLDAPVEEARIGYETERQRVSNARADRERKQVEEFVKISERNMAKAEKERINEEIDTKEDELKKADNALGADPQVLRAQDRISAMGGFATAGAASLSGLSSKDRSYEELRQHRQLLKTEIEELKKIAKNTEDGTAVYD